ncbi:MAG: hypothetical protein RBU35_24520 [Anaerolineae bacterium]|nr:hypothetical protein [Anaerolineae bacterium]
MTLWPQVGDAGQQTKPVSKYRVHAWDLAGRAQQVFGRLIIQYLVLGVEGGLQSCMNHRLVDGRESLTLFHDRWQAALISETLCKVGQGHFSCSAQKRPADLEGKGHPTQQLANGFRRYMVAMILAKTFWPLGAMQQQLQCRFLLQWSYFQSSKRTKITLPGGEQHTTG